MSIYKERGYKNRTEYLRELANENGADLQAVFALADMLGPDEDFDGLVASVEDWSWENEEYI
jgi:phosphopantetheine adenylyltransferase